MTDRRLDSDSMFLSMCACLLQTVEWGFVLRSPSDSRYVSNTRKPSRWAHLSGRRLQTCATGLADSNYCPILPLQQNLRQYRGLPLDLLPCVVTTYLGKALNNPLAFCWNPSRQSGVV